MERRNALLVPCIVRDELHSRRFSKNGRIILNGPVTFESFGREVKAIADAVVDTVWGNGPDDPGRTLSLLLLHAARMGGDKGDAPESSESSSRMLWTDGFIDAMVHVCGAGLVQTCILAKNIVPENLSKARIGTSVVHGNGVFASQNLRRGELITVYPSDVVAFDDAKQGGMRLHRSDGKKLTHIDTMKLLPYMCRVEGTNLSIAADPDREACPAACGHLINDGSFLHTPNFTIDEAKLYIEESTRLQNCYFVPISGCCVVVLASRDIVAGEEILTAYGLSYFQFINRPSHEQIKIEEAVG